MMNNRFSFPLKVDVSKNETRLRSSGSRISYTTNSLCSAYEPLAVTVTCCGDLPKMACILHKPFVVPSLVSPCALNFVDFIHYASRISLGQNVKVLIYRWRQIRPFKIFTLSASLSTKEVSMFKLAINICFETYFGLIHAAAFMFVYSNFVLLYIIDLQKFSPRRLIVQICPHSE